MGAGGIPEGVIATCSVKALGGAMLGRLAPQSDQEREAVKKAGLDTSHILDCDELVSADDVFFPRLVSQMESFSQAFAIMGKLPIQSL